MSRDDLRILSVFGAGMLLMRIIVQQPWYCEAGIAAIPLAVFWKQLSRLGRAVWDDYQAWRLERQLEHSVHVDADARTAYRLLIERGKR